MYNLEKESNIDEGELLSKSTGDQNKIRKNATGKSLGTGANFDDDVDEKRVGLNNISLGDKGAISKLLGTGL